MSNTAQDVDGFKAILASDMSDGAKLAAIAELLGAASATEIAAALNKSIRTVERHYAELRKVRKFAGTRNCVDTQICVPEARKSAESATQICVESSRAPASIDSRATKELPSEVLCEEDIITPIVPPGRKTSFENQTRRTPSRRLDPARRLEAVDPRQLPGSDAGRRAHRSPQIRKLLAGTARRKGLQARLAQDVAELVADGVFASPAASDSPRLSARRRRFPDRRRAQPGAPARPSRQA